ncbi:MAG: methyl-accepting chemotaxis protein [Deltaproteobacteria bacterium]|nr:methyl-accepting chemotaxis protein [Deltaproteobacteria bacterium]
MSPRLQWGSGLFFAAVVLAGGVLFGWSFYREARGALRIASLQAHYEFLSPYPIVGPALVRSLAALFVMTMAASALVFFLQVRRIREGVARLVEVFRISGEGDMSTPADAPGIDEIASLGRKVDAIRSETLSLVAEIREEAEILRKEPLPPEEFRKRWDALKGKIGRIAP